VLTFEGFSRDDAIVLDVTEPDAPRLVGNTRITSGGEGFEISFVPAIPGGRYAALPVDLARVPDLVVDQPSDLRLGSNRADYLVIAGSGLEEAAEDLAEYRQHLGLETQMVRLQDVYDEFNQGIVSPWAIRDFLAYATSRWQLGPGSVVLVGDSSFDFKDRLGFGGNLLPAPMTSTSEGLFPSDHRTVDLIGDDGVPELAVGRLPVRDNAQLAAYLAKLQSYEAAAGAWKNRSVWVADGVDEGGEFIDDTEELIPRIPPTLDVDRIYVDELGAGVARQQLLETLNEGALLVHFLGHGNLMQMGDNEGLLKSGDVPGLGNAERQPVLTAMTCALGRFDRIFFDTLSESLVLRGDGGVIALWAPTGFSFNQDGVQLSQGFLPRAFESGEPISLGEAVMEALSNYLATAEEPIESVPFVYTLLGDPAIRLQP